MWCQDACFAYRGRRDSAARVILVGIDDATLVALPKPLTSISPELGEVVTYLRDRGARAVGLDLMIPETLDGYDLRSLAAGGDRADQLAAVLAYQRLGAYTEALALLERLTKEAPEESMYRRELAELYRLAGRPEAAGGETAK